MKPFFSIIIPTLNEEKYLPHLLSDLNGQTYQDFEVIVVDGDSTDKTVQKATASKIKGLRILQTKTKNVCYQRNLGAKNAKTNYLIFMDADNRVPPYFLQGIKYRIDSSSLDMFTTWISPDGEDLGTYAICNVINLWLDIQQKTNEPWMIEALLVTKKKVFQSLKGFDVKVHINEGYDLVSRAIKNNFTYGVFKDPLYTFSLRRLRKIGTFKAIASVAKLELFRITKQKMDVEQIRKIYPMEGGHYFIRNDKLAKLASSIIRGK